MASLLSFPHTVLDRAYTTVDIEICLDEDWDDPFVVTEGEKPIDLTGKRLELTVVPAFGYPTAICTLTSAVDGGIFIEQPTFGAAYIYRRQDVVSRLIRPGRWKQFLVLCDDVVNSHAPKRELWRGDLVAHAGLGGLR